MDHLAIDLGRMRLYIAELGNDSLGVVDLKQHVVLRTVTGLKEPQGVGYLPSAHTVYVANAGDGSLTVFDAGDLSPLSSISLGDDADNVRIDAVSQHVFVGYGKGLADIDPATGKIVANVALPGHPESFQLEDGGSRVFVNIPEAQQIAVVDRNAGKVVASWRLTGAAANFPLALDQTHQELVSVFRSPPSIGVFEVSDGKERARLPACGDADDVFVDTKRQRLYAICGEGEIDVLSRESGTYQSLEKVPTVPGARTGLFVPELDRLFVAVRATSAEPAAIWVFQPPH
jgi:hypothetical protein